MAEESSDVPKELIESVRDVIGRKIKISVKKKVKLETKGDKVDNKVLTASASADSAVPICFSLGTLLCRHLLRNTIAWFTFCAAEFL
ncbi:leucine-rich repeat-containing protein 16A isoform 1 [Amazona aestiva]|uniref:Leucine-rich repeat-containing protein 16A isoform 1 n=1 Tax=Amazona aestiva TaxID=12930 RepID=A0A0Q3MBL6_AMAAE|nr:leucine-rich repeat-containing protein 16A isoform 1 [Amazona aestiva]